MKNSPEISGRQGGRSRSIVVPLAGVSAALFALWMVLEISFRLLFPSVVGNIQYHPRYGWTPSRNVAGIYRERGALWDSEYRADIRTNDFGARTELDPAPDTTANRILLLGDSFCFGWGVSDRDLHSARLEAMLNQSRDERPSSPVWQVINLGMTGFGPDQELLLWKDIGHLYEPRTVILFLFLGNDFSDIMYRFSPNNSALKPVFEESGDTFVLTGTPVPYDYHWTLRRLLRSSHFIHFVLWRIQRLREAPPTVLRLHEPLTVDASDSVFDSLKYRKMGFILRALKDDVERNDAEFRIVAIPSREQWESRRSGGSSGIEGLEFLRFWAQRNGVPLLDLLSIPEYLEFPDVYFTRDAHWRPQAQGLIASILENWLEPHSRSHPVPVP